jgi:hypothetical protein
MTGIAFCRKPPPALACSKLMRWALGRSNRRGQDKARKVRAVGWGRVERRNPVIPQTLRNSYRKLDFSATCYRRLDFRTL